MNAAEALARPIYCRSHLLIVGDVGAEYLDLRPQILQRLYLPDPVAQAILFVIPIPFFFGGQRGSSDQDQSRLNRSGQVFSKRETEPPVATGNQIYSMPAQYCGLSRAILYAYRLKGLRPANVIAIRQDPVRRG